MIRRGPRIGRYLLLSLRDELLALGMFCRHQWYALLAALLAILVAAYFISPLPPSKIRIASGQENSTLESMAKRYGEYFAQHGVSVEFFSTRGAAGNLEALREGRVDVAFSQGGLAIGGDEGIVSLGSVGYQPLWFFYIGEKFTGTDFVGFLEGKRISVGLPGSGTRPVADALLSLLPTASRKRIQTYELSPAGSASSLTSGEIDGMFLLAGMESGNARRLLERPDVNILNYPVADALPKYLDYLEVIALPQGAIALSPPRPAQALKMVATTTTILADESLHPALMYLFMRAASDLAQGEPDFFERPGGFPAFTESNIPRSATAERYLSSGPPLLENHAPYWVASFFDRAWFMILALLAILYPLLRLFPGYRITVFDITASDRFGETFGLLAALEHESPERQQRLPELRAEYEQLRHEIAGMWVPKGCHRSYYFLCAALRMLESRLLAAEQAELHKEERQKSGPPSASARVRGEA